MEKSQNCALAILYYYSTKTCRMAGLGQINCKINSTTKKGGASNDALLQH